MSTPGETCSAVLQDAAKHRLAERDPAPPQLSWVAQTSSTNSDLLAAGPPPPEGRARLAELQIAGRGRLGRRWQSRPGGSLCLSLSLAWPGGPAAAAGASLVAGAAVAECLHGLGAGEVGLKWPNDLWARDLKLGGILVETGGRAEQAFVVVGLGLNLDLPSDFAVGQAWIDLAALGLRMDRAELAAVLLLSLRTRLRQLQQQGLAGLLPVWQRFDCLWGRAVRMTAGDESWQGVARGVAADGGLRVQHAGGERVWHSGEASPRPT